MYVDNRYVCLYSHQSVLLPVYVWKNCKFEYCVLAQFYNEKVKPSDWTEKSFGNICTCQTRSFWLDLSARENHNSGTLRRNNWYHQVHAFCNKFGKSCTKVCKERSCKERKFCKKKFCKERKASKVEGQWSNKMTKKERKFRKKFYNVLAGRIVFSCYLIEWRLRFCYSDKDKNL